MAMLLYSRPKCVLLTVKQAAPAAARKGEGPPPGQEVFDSNCITPGTAFMARLGDHLRFFIRHKMATDPVWQRPRIIFSGAAISVWGWMPSGPAEGRWRDKSRCVSTKGCSQRILPAFEPDH